MIKVKTKIIVAVFCFLAVFCTLVCTYVFDKLARYKCEMARLYNYHTAVQHRQQEDIEILFKRLNKIDALQQCEEERLEKLEWLSTHSY